VKCLIDNFYQLCKTTNDYQWIYNHQRKEKNMAQTEVKKLDSRDLFPEMELKVIDSTSLMLPNKKGGTWSVLLIYRGLW